MTVSFKAPVKSAVVNNAFVSKQANDVKVGQLGLNKASEGNQVFSVQKSVNELFDVTGTGEGDPNAKNYNNNNYIADGDSHKTAIEKLDAQVKNNADTIGDHINEALDAHDASAVSYDNTDSGLVAINTQDAIDEVESRLDTAETNISNHINNATDAHDASAISYVNTTSGLTAINAQAAIDEVEGRLGTAESDIQAIEDSIGQANGIAPLNGSSKIDATYLPSYVDDVLEYADIASLPLVGEQGKIYVTIDTNKTYRWTGSIYVEISASPVTSVNSQTGVVVLDADDIAETATRYWSKKNNVANTMPLVGNDASENYSVGSQWYDAINDTLYICEDATIGAAVWQPISGAGGGVGSVDIMFADTFENTDIADYTITQPLASISAVSPLQGENSLLIAHDFNPNYYIERIIPVDNKFKNKNVTFTLDVFSNAASGDLTLSVWDHTNTVQLLNSELIQPQDVDQTSAKRSFSFNIPSGANELRYRINVLFDSGKVSRVDNLVIELTQMSKLDTTIETPIITEWVDAGPITIGATTTAPTKGTTSVDRVRHRRVGDSIHFRLEYKQTAASVSTGSGDYLFALPSGLQFDTAKVKLFSTIGSANTRDVALGTASVQVAANVGDGVVVPYSSTQFRIYASDTASASFSAISSSYFSVNNTATGYQVDFMAPILGWEATETQSVSLAQTVLVQESDSYIRVNTANGSGSTATRVRKYSGSPSSVGDAARFEQDDVNGARFVIQKSGIFTIMVTEDASNGATHGMTKNLSGAQLSTSIDALFRDPLYANNVLATQGDSGAMNGTASWTGPLVIGDIIRPQHNGQTPTDNDSYSFQLTYQGSLKQLNVSENQKIEIPTSELRMEGASSRGTGSNSAIVRFDNIAKLRGDAFTVESTAALGTVVTMKKKGKLDVSSSFLCSTGQALVITLNQSTRTGLPLLPSEILANMSNTGASAANSKWSGFVNIGDQVRVASQAAPTANILNSLNLSFQEQEVAVSVTNALPQFSESDSSVRIDTANGYGSTATKIRRFSTVRTNIGSAVTYADSAVDGASFTINESGLYHLSYTDELNAAQEIGISLNADATDRTTNYGSLAKAKRLTVASANTNFATCSAASVYLQAGDVVRAHSNGSPNGDQENAYFIISKVGKPNVTGVDVTPFAKIEYEVKDEVQANTYAGYGSTNTRIPYYTNVTKNTNRGLIRVENSATLGFSITVLKACELTIKSTHVVSASTAHGLTLNSAQLSTSIFSINPPERLTLAYTSVNDLNQSQVASYTGFFQAGDVIRPHTSAATPINPNRCNISVVATELRDAYQVIGGGVENTYSAYVSVAPAVTSESYPFIESVTSGGTGIRIVNFKSGFFTATPFVTGSANVGVSSAENDFFIQSVSASSVTIRTTNSNALANVAFTIMVQRQGSDYRTPSKAIGLPVQRIAYVQRTVGPATSAGTSVAGSWNTIPLATVQDPSGIGVSLASNIITLPAGTYDIKAMSAHRSADTQIRLRNITESSTALVGLSAYGSNASDAAIMTSTAEGIITLNSAKTFELQYRVAIGFTFGLGGMGSNFAENVLTASVKIVKLEE